MGDFNKIFSFILGLLVVVVILAIATKRFNLSNKVRFLGGKAATITPTPYDTIEVSGKTSNENSKNESVFNTGYTGKVPEQTPKTGPSEAFLLISFSSGLAGVYLRKKS